VQFEFHSHRGFSWFYERIVKHKIPPRRPMLTISPGHEEREGEVTRVSPWSSPTPSALPCPGATGSELSTARWRSCALVQAYTSQSALTVCVVASIAPLRSWKLKAKPLVTIKCQAWFYLRLVAYSFFGYPRGHRVINGTAAHRAHRLN